MLWPVSSTALEIGYPRFGLFKQFPNHTADHVARYEQQFPFHQPGGTPIVRRDNLRHAVSGYDFEEGIHVSS